MKRALVAIALIPICLYGVAWLVAVSVQQWYAPGEWPLGLGTLKSSATRYPEEETNAAAQMLMTLTPPLGISTTPKTKAVPLPHSIDTWNEIKEPLDRFTHAELERIGDRLTAPPPEVAAFLVAHEGQINAVRNHVLTAGPIRWHQHASLGLDAPLPNLLGQMSLTKLFTARALAKAANHDATAWDDLHAVWLLDRELWKRPELISTLIALASTRMVNAAATKMPLPVPAWFGEVQSLDYSRSFAASIQADAATFARAARTRFSEHKFQDIVMRPYTIACTADLAETMRRWTGEMVANRRCDYTPPQTMSVASWNIIGKIAMPNLTGSWQRVNRFRAEREATDKILALRRGETPSSTSQCSDGTWIVTPQSLKFSRDIGVPSGIKYPLTYQK